MNKGELIEAMASKAKLSRKDAAAALDAALDTIRTTLKNGDRVLLVDFGTFELRRKTARVARNPRTKELMQVPANNFPAFKAGKGLKEAMN